MIEKRNCVVAFRNKVKGAADEGKLEELETDI